MCGSRIRSRFMTYSSNARRFDNIAGSLKVNSQRRRSLFARTNLKCTSSYGTQEIPASRFTADAVLGDMSS